MASTVIRLADIKWLPSRHTIGWEFSGLLYQATRPFHGPFTVRCRCGAGIVYDPWVSDSVVEYLVLSGELTVNGMVLKTGDYARVDAGEDGLLRSSIGMEALCIVREQVIWAREVLDMLHEGTLTDEAAQALMRSPWMEHLRRNLSKADAQAISKMKIEKVGSDRIKELVGSIVQV